MQPSADGPGDFASCVDSQPGSPVVARNLPTPEAAGSAARPGLSYAGRMSAVEAMLQELQQCDDLERALALFEECSGHLDECDKVVAAASGRFQELLARQPQESGGSEC